MVWANELTVAPQPRRSGSLAVVVTIMLVLVIGALTSINSIAYAVLLRLLPIVDPALCSPPVGR